MSFAIGGPATHWGSDSGSIFGIDPIHVERDMITGSASSSGSQSFFHHGTHAALIDVAHGIDLGDACSANIVSFRCVDIANADDDTILRRNLRRPLVNICQLRWS